MAFEKVVGTGVLLSWDSAGGSSFTTIASIVDGDKMTSTWKMANTSLLSDVVETFQKTTLDPGSYKFTVAYSPYNTEYAALKTNFLSYNALPPQWKLTFPNEGDGSGSGTFTFYAHIE